MGTHVDEQAVRHWDHRLVFTRGNDYLRDDTGEIVVITRRDVVKMGWVEFRALLGDGHVDDWKEGMK